MLHLWFNCHAATLAGGRYAIIENAALVTDGVHIHWIGPHAELPAGDYRRCLLYTSPSPRDRQKSRMPSSA